MSTANRAGTLHGLVASNAETRGGATAIREKRRGIWQSWTWREVHQDAQRIAAALSRRGIRPGDRIALLSDNRPNLFIASVGIQSAGAVPSPLYQDANATEVAAWLGMLQPRAVFVENQEQVDKVLSLIEGCPSIETIIYDRDRGLGHYRDPRLLSLQALKREGETSPPPSLPSIDPGQPAFVFFSAGTSGASQAIVHSHASLLARAQAAIQAEGFSASDTTVAYLSPGWSCHLFLSWILPVATGSCVCCPEAADTLLNDLREIAPTRFVGTPRVLELVKRQVEDRISDTGGFSERLFRRGVALAESGASSTGLYGAVIFAPLRDFLGMSRIRGAYAVGDAIDPETIAFLRALGVNLKKLYGCTETGYFDALLADAHGPANEIGTPLPGSEIRLSDSGEVLVRSNGLFIGYLGELSARERVVDSDGWFHTGDFGIRTGDGGIQLRDRVADVGHFSNGEPFSPKQVERRLVARPEIAEAVAIGDHHDGVCALIDLDTTAVSRWADSQGIAYSGHADLAALPEVARLIGDAIAQVNTALATSEGLPSHQVRRFVLLPEPITPASGLLTPTGKIRRQLVQRHYGRVIDAMFAGAASAPVPGTAGEDVTVALHDAVRAAATPGRRSA
jgi:long-chain acyl-CoA synthetase